MGGHLTIEEKNAWKESVLESRLDDFIILKDWLKAEKIEFENHGYFIIVKNMIIEFDLKVAFSAGRKKASRAMKCSVLEFATHISDQSTHSREG